jgi:hypothetical protein
LRTVDHRQTGHAGFAASRAAQIFVPLICHEATLGNILERRAGSPVVKNEHPREIFYFSFSRH